VARRNPLPPPPPPLATIGAKSGRNPPTECGETGGGLSIGACFFIVAFPVGARQGWAPGRRKARVPNRPWAPPAPNCGVSSESAHFLECGGFPPHSSPPGLVAPSLPSRKKRPPGPARPPGKAARRRFFLSECPGGKTPAPVAPPCSAESLVAMFCRPAHFKN